MDRFPKSLENAIIEAKRRFEEQSALTSELGPAIFDTRDAAPFALPRAYVTGPCLSSDESSNNSRTSESAVVAVSHHTPNALTSFLNDCYYMGHKNQGRVIVFNHFQFDDFENRDGTHEDVRRIENTFGIKLGFKVKVYDDLTVSQILQVVHGLSQADFSDDNCLVIIILTHGIEKGLLKSKQGFYTLDDIYEKLAGDRCPTLAGKPKLFFIQACRGAKCDPGVEIQRRLEGQTSRDLPQFNSFKIPSHSDIFMGFSCFENYVSWRSSMGTFFIQSLCDVLDTNSDRDDLLSMTTAIVNKVGEKRSVSADNTEHDMMQTATFITTLRKKFYFNH